MPKISVIMGIYNTNNEEMVSLAVDSILQQTYRDFEFIICDDGSTDGTYQMIKKLASKDSRIIVIRNEENIGLAATLNNCLEIAQGQYVARMDADDISGLDRFEEQVKFLDNNSEYAMVGCNSELFNDSGVWGKRMCKITPEKRDFLFGSSFIHPCIMMRAEFYQELGGYRVDQTTLRAEDYDLFMRLYAAGYKGFNIQKTLFYFREDTMAYKRRKYKCRLDEAKVRYRGFKALGLFPRAIPYIIKPLIVGLIPQKILAVMRNEHL